MKKKLLLIIIPIIVFVVSAGVGYVVIRANQNASATPDETSATSAETVAVNTTAEQVTEDQTALQTTAKPTEAHTQLNTEALTEPPYSDAYRAFSEVLSNSESQIRAYDWQYKDDPPHPVAFADVMGDDTPEMIFVYSRDDNARLRVVTYNGVRAVEAIDYSLADNNKNMRGRMFLSQIDGELYLFTLTAPGVAKFETAYRFADNGDYALEIKEVVRYSPRTDLQNSEYGQSRINGSVVSSSEAKDAYYSLAEQTEALLMSSSDSNGNSYPRTVGLDAEHYPNHSKTFDEAVSFLNEQ